jgi:hypothetical protein
VRLWICAGTLGQPPHPSIHKAQGHLRMSRDDIVSSCRRVDLAGRYANGGRLFFDEMPRRAREQ